MNWSAIRQVDDVINKFGTEERIKRFQSGELMLVERNQAQESGALLNFERKVPISARSFVVAGNFTKKNKKVKFGYIDDQLLKLFGNIRKDLSAGEVAIQTLLQDSHDPEMMVALGPQSVRFISLGQFYSLLEAQGQGQEGSLLVNGYANVAYILDENGAPWAVSANWYRGYGDWHVFVYSVANLLGWRAGRQVLSQAV